MCSRTCYGELIMADSKAGKGYRSPINLGLPQVPQATNEEDFAQYLLMYNAIHMLNAYLDQIRLVLEGGNPEDKPSDSMRFMRSFWVEADVDIAAGAIITVINNKGVLGAKRRSWLGHVDSFLTGVALSDAVAGEKVRFGVGPAIMNVPGFVAGQVVWAPLAGETGAGSMLPEEPPDEADIETVAIGECIMDGYIMITSGFSY